MLLLGKYFVNLDFCDFLSRRMRSMQRHQLWNEKISERNHMKFLMQDQHRDRIEAQLAHEQARQHKEQQTIHHTRDFKKKISAEMRAKIEENQYREQDREKQRIHAMTARRERREDIKDQRANEIHETIQRRQVSGSNMENEVYYPDNQPRSYIPWRAEIYYENVSSTAPDKSMVSSPSE